MRTVHVLNSNLPQTNKLRKVTFVDGKRITLKEAIELLKKAGHKIEIKNLQNNTVASKYKGVPISCTLWGKVVWAKDEKNSKKLTDSLIEDRYFSHFCRMPVELKQDNL